jgi:hypothetical protein
MHKYYKISDSKQSLYITVDDSGALIIMDEAGRKVFLSKYQAKLMKFGIENLLKGLLAGADESKVKVEELSRPPKV